MLIANKVSGTGLTLGAWVKCSSEMGLLSMLEDIQLTPADVLHRRLTAARGKCQGRQRMARLSASLLEVPNAGAGLTGMVWEQMDPGPFRALKAERTALH